MIDDLGIGTKANSKLISKRVVPQADEDIDDLWGGPKQKNVIPMS